MTENKIEMDKTYDPSRTEKRLYEWWKSRGFFKPETCLQVGLADPDQPAWCITMPPPNITGALHLGHAMTAAVEDLMTRYYRMRGRETLFLPGSDHAGIATQNVVERELRKQGLTRHELGREVFVQKVWEWKETYQARIAEQHKRLGISCDWDRDRFTLDEGLSHAVRTAFVRLYKKGLIYRGAYLVNWCPRCESAISDEGHERFGRLVGRTAVLPAIERRIPIISDELVDPEFGTGAVKVTPAHDPNDYEMGLRHNLEAPTVLDDRAVMNELAGPYEGLDRYECREAIVRDFDKEGLLIKIEAYHHAVAHCQRCDTVIEPRISTQWFLNVEPLAQAALDAVRRGETTIIPEREERRFYHWLENIRPWCISRQLWWGHRIPVWYCRDCGEQTCELEDPTQCAHCGSTNLERDPDVLDTWFSSGLWPFSTLGWPEDTPDMRRFYPTDMRETGYDILFFWVAREMMLGLEMTGQAPYATVYLHGLVRNELHVAHQLDAGQRHEPRPAPARGQPQLWQQDLERSAVHRLQPPRPGGGGALHRPDSYQYGEAGRRINDFFWSEFCDWYIEACKIRLYGEDTPVGRAQRATALVTLVTVLDRALRLLHPYMPFVTEEIWQHLKAAAPGGGSWPEALMICPWPEVDEAQLDDQAEADMALLMDLIRQIRNARAEFNVTPGKRVPAIIVGGAKLGMLQAQRRLLTFLAQVNDEELMLSETLTSKPRQAVALVSAQGVEAYLPLAGLVDLEQERARLHKALAEAERQIQHAEKMLANENFTSKAPAHVIQQQRDRLAEQQERRSRLQERLRALES